MILPRELAYTRHTEFGVGPQRVRCKSPKQLTTVPGNPERELNHLDASVLEVRCCRSPWGIYETTHARWCRAGSMDHTSPAKSGAVRPRREDPEATSRRTAARRSRVVRSRRPACGVPRLRIRDSAPLGHTHRGSAPRARPMPALCGLCAPTAHPPDGP